MTCLNTHTNKNATISFKSASVRILAASNESIPFSWNTSTTFRPSLQCDVSHSSTVIVLRELIENAEHVDSWSEESKGDEAEGGRSCRIEELLSNRERPTVGVSVSSLITRVSRDIRFFSGGTPDEGRMNAGCGWLSSEDCDCCLNMPVVLTGTDMCTTESKLSMGVDGLLVAEPGTENADGIPGVSNDTVVQSRSSISDIGVTPHEAKVHPSGHRCPRKQRSMSCMEAAWRDRQKK